MMALRTFFTGRRTDIPHSYLHELGILFVVNQVIALLLVIMGGEGSLFQNLLTSNAIGLSIWSLYEGFEHLPRLPRWVRHVSVPCGILLGFKLAGLTGGFDGTRQFIDPVRHWRTIATCTLLACVATAIVVLYLRNVTYRAELATEQRRAADARQSETAAQLALLQAQIEPHFLFNTLANVRSLIVQNPPLAQTMLDHLNGYLRASLGRTRRPSSTLADELQIVEPLLAIAAMRLQSRLSWRIAVPDHLRNAILPPLLLQPLVENALEHGIDAAIDGGDVTVQATQTEDGRLRLTVTDTGLGLNANLQSDGVGLLNVQQRLASLYGAAGRLALYPNLPRGVIAELVLPLTQEQC